jgi:hypothetical protein
MMTQMQIVTTILANIRWSAELPQALRDILNSLAAIFSIDFAALMSSIDCAGDLMPKEKWLLAMMMPIGLATLFLFWASSAHLWLRDKPKIVRQGIMQAILCAAVNVLLIGCYKSIAEKTFAIFDCDQPIEGEWVLIMDAGPCPILAGDSSSDSYGYFGLSMLILYVILPFVYVAIQLWRYARKGDLERQINESYTFRVTVGWAVEPYKPKAYLWEPLNALIKASMVAGTVLLRPANRTIAHSVVMFASFVLHAWVRPFKSRHGNIVILLFCVCDLFGIIIDSFERNSDSERTGAIVAVQILFVVILFSTLIFTLVALKKAVMPRIRRARAKLAKSHKSFHKTTSIMPIDRESVNDDAGDDDAVERGVTLVASENDTQIKRDSTLMSGQPARNDWGNMRKMSKCEIFMLLPFIVAVTVPLVIASFIPWAFGRLISWAALRTTKVHIKKQESTKKSILVSTRRYERSLGYTVAAILYLPVVGFSFVLWYGLADCNNEQYGFCNRVLFFMFLIHTACYVCIIILCTILACCGFSKWIPKFANTVRLAFLWPRYILLYIATYTYLQEIVQTIFGMHIVKMEKALWKIMYGRNQSPPRLWMEHVRESEDQIRRDAEAAAARAKVTAEDNALLTKLRVEYGADSRAYKTQLRKIQGLPPIPDIPIETFQLKVIAGPHRGKAYTGTLKDWDRDLDEDGDRPSFVFGSSRHVDFSLYNDEMASGTHAELTRISKGGVLTWYLSDLDSTNGTEVRTPEGAVIGVAGDYDSDYDSGRDDDDLEVKTSITSGSLLLIGESKIKIRFGASLNGTQEATVLGPRCSTGKHTMMVYTRDSASGDAEQSSTVAAEVVMSGWECNKKCGPGCGINPIVGTMHVKPMKHDVPIWPSMCDECWSSWEDNNAKSEWFSIFTNRSAASTDFICEGAFITNSSLKEMNGNEPDDDQEYFDSLFESSEKVDFEEFVLMWKKKTGLIEFTTCRGGDFPGVLCHGKECVNENITGVCYSNGEGRILCGTCYTASLNDGEAYHPLYGLQETIIDAFVSRADGIPKDTFIKMLKVAFAEAAEEEEDAEIPISTIEEFFEIADANKDGKISFQESVLFSSWMTEMTRESEKASTGTAPKYITGAKVEVRHSDGKYYGATLGKFAEGKDKYFGKWEVIWDTGERTFNVGEYSIRRPASTCDKCSTTIGDKTERWHCEACSSNICFQCVPKSGVLECSDKSAARDPVCFMSSKGSKIEFRINENRRIDFLVNDLIKLKDLSVCSRIADSSGLQLYIKGSGGEISTSAPDAETAERAIALFISCVVRMVLVTSNSSGWRIRSEPSLGGRVLSTCRNGTIISVVEMHAGIDGAWLKLADSAGYCLRGEMGEGWCKQSVAFISTQGSTCEFRLNESQLVDFYLNGILKLGNLTMCIASGVKITMSGTLGGLTDTEQSLTTTAPNEATGLEIEALFKLRGSMLSQSSTVPRLVETPAPTWQEACCQAFFFFLCTAACSPLVVLGTLCSNRFPCNFDNNFIHTRIQVSIAGYWLLVFAILIVFVPTLFLYFMGLPIGCLLYILIACLCKQKTLNGPSYESPDE